MELFIYGKSNCLFHRYDGFHPYITNVPYYIISVLVPVLVRVPEYLSKSTSTITLELTSTSTRNSVLEYCEYEYRVRVPQPCSYISMIWQWQFSITTSDGLLLDLTVYRCLSLHQQWMLVDKWLPKFVMSIQFQQHCGADQLSCVAASGPRACHNLASGRSGKTQAVIANWSHTWL